MHKLSPLSLACAVVDSISIVAEVADKQVC